MKSTTVKVPASAKASPSIVQRNKVPVKENGFGKFVASKQAATAATPKLTAPQPPAPPARPVLAEHNGRKEYTPGTIGSVIWQVADELQKVTPNTPVTASAVRIALPTVKPASVSAGLSHWRKFHGTLHTKMQTQ